MATEPRFPLGVVVATPGALRALEQAAESASELLGRHVLGDWGDLCAEDTAANEQALECGFRLLSSYVLSIREKVWVVTESDRSSTCMLLPGEY